MFPLSQEEMQKMGIHHTMRVLPHDQNSGGFYVALFKKHHDFEWKYGNKGEKPQNKMEEEDVEKDEEFLKANLPDIQNDIAVENNDDRNGEQEDSDSES